MLPKLLKQCGDAYMARFLEIVGEIPGVEAVERGPRTAPCRPEGLML